MNKTEEKALTRNKMIEAAIVEFGLHGYEGASTNQICAGASISKGLLYHYFKSKENLFEETLRYCMEDFHRAEQDACCGKLAGIDYLAAVYGLHIAFFAAHPYHYQLIAQFVTSGALSQNNQALRRCREEIWQYGLEALSRFLDNISLKPETDRKQAMEVLIVLIGSIQRKYISAVQQNGLAVKDAQQQFKRELRDTLGLICRGIAA
ncbi:MAG: hypothetical protein DBY45_09595 [Clostridiales bacterium]|nr:MAG: hypothetical protein DBY45_09595 [Clostridiales bacterium]